MNSVPSEEDNIITLLLLFCGVGGFGLFSASTFFAPVQVWMVEQGILVAGQNVLLGWGENLVGFDLPRIIVAVGATLLLIVLLVSVVRKRRSRRDV
jgi:hypothetical protein